MSIINTTGRNECVASRGPCSCPIPSSDCMAGCAWSSRGAGGHFGGSVSLLGVLPGTRKARRGPQCTWALPGSIPGRTSETEAAIRGGTGNPSASGDHGALVMKENGMSTCLMEDWASRPPVSHSQDLPHLLLPPSPSLPLLPSPSICLPPPLHGSLANTEVTQDDRKREIHHGPHVLASAPLLRPCCAPVSSLPLLWPQKSAILLSSLPVWKG